MFFCLHCVQRGRPTNHPSHFEAYVYARLQVDCGKRLWTRHTCTPGVALSFVLCSVLWMCKKWPCDWSWCSSTLLTHSSFSLLYELGDSSIWGGYLAFCEVCGMWKYVIDERAKEDGGSSDSEWWEWWHCREVVAMARRRLYIERSMLLW